MRFYPPHVPHDCSDDSDFSSQSSNSSEFETYQPIAPHRALTLATGAALVNTVQLHSTLQIALHLPPQPAPLPRMNCPQLQNELLASILKFVPGNGRVGVESALLNDKNGRTALWLALEEELRYLKDAIQKIHQSGNDTNAQITLLNDLKNKNTKLMTVCKRLMDEEQKNINQYTNQEMAQLPPRVNYRGCPTCPSCPDVCCCAIPLNCISECASQNQEICYCCGGANLLTSASLTIAVCCASGCSVSLGVPASITGVCGACCATTAFYNRPVSTGRRHTPINPVMQLIRDAKYYKNAWCNFFSEVGTYCGDLAHCCTKAIPRGINKYQRRKGMNAIDARTQQMSQIPLLTLLEKQLDDDMVINKIPLATSDRDAILADAKEIIEFVQSADPNFLKSQVGQLHKAPIQFSMV